MYTARCLAAWQTNRDERCAARFLAGATGMLAKAETGACGHGGLQGTCGERTVCRQHRYLCHICRGLFISISVSLLAFLASLTFSTYPYLRSR